MGRKRALITGITGQTGSYMAELLLSLNYEVHGTIRRNSTPSDYRIAHLLKDITLHSADLHDQMSLLRVLEASKPAEVYNFAAQSFVPDSWHQPVFTADVTAVGVTKLLEAIRTRDKDIKFYQASSSEMFGLVQAEPQNERTPFYPRSPYGVAKLYGHWITINYRESHDMFACSGIAYNHESPRRGTEFVTRKITLAAARIKHGLQEKLALGNLQATRDWGHAADYVRAMNLMLQQSKPADYVIATGEKHSVEQFAKLAFECLDLDYKQYVVCETQLLRPAEVHTLLGDCAKARSELRWEPTISFGDLVREMVMADYEMVANSM